MKLWQKNLILLALVVIITLVPLALIKGEEFAGADTVGQQMITQINPEYEPWMDSFFTPPSGEIESLIFALQALIGGLVIGFGFGRLTAENSAKKKEQKDVN